MSDDTLRRQDAAAHLPFGVFCDGLLIQSAGDRDIDGAYDLRNQLAGRDGVPCGTYEVLLPCPVHPSSSAVDCLDCEPA